MSEIRPLKIRKVLLHLFFCWCLSCLMTYTWLKGDDYETLKYYPLALKYHAIGFLFFALALANLKAAMPGEFDVKWMQVLRNLREKFVNDPRRLTWRKGK